ncbi:MAG: polymer-forming cytoskeletal protein [Caulobacterales bacterium]
MFSKPTSNPAQGATPATPATPALSGAAEAPPLAVDAAPRAAAPRGAKVASLVASDMTLEGNISGGGEIQIDGVIKGDVRVERVTVGDGGQVDGGIYAEAVEVRGKVSGSITAKQVRLYGACHVDGDITHEQLAMETGAFFQGRSLRLQRPAQGVATSAKPEPNIPLRDTGNGLSAKTAPTASA